MTEPTMTTAEALAAVQKQLAALEKVLDERRFAEAAVITLANGNFLTATDSHRFPVGNAAMGTLYGASEMFEKLGDNWDDLLSDIRSSVHELASLAISEKTQP